MGSQVHSEGGIDWEKIHKVSTHQQTNNPNSRSIKINKTKVEREKKRERIVHHITPFYPFYPFPPRLPPFFIRTRLRDMGPMGPKPSSPLNPCTSSTSTSHARNDNVKNTTNTSIDISTGFSFGGEVIYIPCNAIDDSLQDTGDTIYDGHAHATDCAKDRFDL